MAASLRAFATCIGINGPFSVLGDFYGFGQPRLPTDPTGARVEVSLTDQINSLRGRHFNLNVIEVGSDQFIASDHDEIDYSIFKVRNIYRQVGLGVGRVLHWGIPTADAGGFDSPTSQDDLDDLTADWSVPNDGIDLFMPHNMMVGGGETGQSAIDGPCGDKDAVFGMSGATCGLWGSEQTARSFAHELGHYLGLSHNHGDACPTAISDKHNLMAQSRCTGGNIRDSTLLTSSQGADISHHCSTKAGC